MKRNQSTIIFVTAGKWQLGGIKIAKKMGYKILCIDEDKNAEGFKISNFTIREKLSNEKEILSQLYNFNLRYEGVISYCSEAGMILASKIRKVYNLVGPNYNITKKLTDKSLQRLIFKKASLNQPYYKIYKNKKSLINDLNKIKLPVIIKPADSSGSKGVYKLEKRLKINNLVDLSFSYSRSKKVILEEFIDGKEFTVETFFQDGNMTLLTITVKKKIKKTKGTVAYALSTVKLSKKYYNQLHSLIYSSYKSIGYKDGAGHAEVIKRKNNFYLIDVAGRGPGFNVFDKFIPLITGINIPRYLIKNSIGESFKLNKSRKLQGIIKYFPSKDGIIKSIKGFELLQKIKGIYGESIVKVGDKTEDAKSDGDRNGYIISIDNSKNTAIRKLKLVEKKIKFIY